VGPRILLTRHGQTAWNALGRLQGHTNIELDDIGREQARALGTKLAGERVRAVWASDLSRARQTAEIVAGALGIVNVHTEPLLRERQFGVFEGLTRDQCASQYPDAWAQWLSLTAAPPGGESRESAVARMKDALTNIFDSLEHDAGVAVAISHGGVMRLWLSEVLAGPVPLVANGAICVVERDSRGFHATAPSDR